MKEQGGNSQVVDEMRRILNSNNFKCMDLFNYVQAYGTDVDKDKLELWLSRITLSNTQKQTMIVDPLNEMLWLELDEEEQEKVKQYEISYDNVTVDELRESIQTFNNLIVRLPTGSYRNNMISRHIFLDWKEFVDQSIEKLIEKDKLFFHTTPKKDEYGHIVYEKDDEGEVIANGGGFLVPKFEREQYEGVGTDGKKHKYVEYYTDKNLSIPLVDYSYIKV